MQASFLSSRSSQSFKTPAFRGVLGGNDKIVEIVVVATKTPEAVRGIRNLLTMTKVLGSIEP